MSPRVEIDAVLTNFLVLVILIVTTLGVTTKIRLLITL